MIGIATTHDSGNEPEAIRQMVEYFGYTTWLFSIGRPRHFIELLSGAARPKPIDFLVLSVHGVDGAFVLPELHESVYEPTEPRSAFGADLVRAHAVFTPQTVVINTGCGLGHADLGHAFMDAGAKCYIAASEDIEGNAVLPFIVRFFYEIRQHQRTVRQAYDLARSIDRETELFTWFGSSER